MKRRHGLTAIFLICLAYIGSSASPRNARAQSPQPLLRVAVVAFTRAESATDFPLIESAVADALARDARIFLIDQSIVRPALTGIRYDGSINMSKAEARRIAAAIGCDFLIVGKADVFTRSEREGESHQQAYAAVMMVDGRTGALADFAFFSEKADTVETALSAIVKAIKQRTVDLTDRVIRFRAMAEFRPAHRATAGDDLIEDVPDEDSSRAEGFKPPEFLNRVKPEYTSEAELADITATVEVMVVFHSNGEIGALEITRWAGFGLDESAARAIHQLKFKPATRGDEPINVRALIRYNFRRVSDPSTRPESQAPKLPEKRERDLRQLFKPTYRRP